MNDHRRQIHLACPSVLAFLSGGSYSVIGFDVTILLGLNVRMFLLEGRPDFALEYFNYNA